MKRTWTIVGVGDVPRSFKWRQALFGQRVTLPAHDYFGQILDSDGTVLFCLHQWGAHEHPSLMSPNTGHPATVGFAVAAHLYLKFANGIGRGAEVLPVEGGIDVRHAIQQKVICVGPSAAARWSPRTPHASRVGALGFERPVDAVQNRLASCPHHCIILGELLRALTSSLLSLLLVITLSWGGCISCEQYFMFGQSHSCCSPDGHCKRKAPVKNDAGRACNQIAFDHQKGVDLHLVAPMMTVERIALPVRMAELLPQWREALPVDPSPPDLQILHSIFLI